MDHPPLIKKNHDAEYTRRYNRFFLWHALGLLPLLVFVAVTWTETESLVWPAVYLSGGSYLCVLLALRFLWRRDIVATMRREGSIDADYRPPLF